MVGGQREVINRPMIIIQLLDIVKRIKPQHQKYAIDELAKQYDRIKFDYLYIIASLTQLNWLGYRLKIT